MFAWIEKNCACAGTGKLATAAAATSTPDTRSTELKLGRFSEIVFFITPLSTAGDRGEVPRPTATLATQLVERLIDAIKVANSGVVIGS